MCGIAICLSPDNELKRRFASNAELLLRHRGPDDSNVWMDEDVVLVHTRLSILDLSSAGNQPMISSSGRYIMSFNGEIYNHLGLRKQFLKRHCFRGHSDTETILALFELLGVRMLDYLVGMWALLIWDVQEKKVFISRDRYGQKPLYWTQTPDGALTFASEIKALRNNESSFTLNTTAAVEYLSLGNYGHLGEDTFINEIKCFPPAHYAFIGISRDMWKANPYWKIPQIAEREKKLFSQVDREILGDLVREAVVGQTLSDVPVGMTLSGGIDSSVIAGVLAQYSAVPVEVFSARNYGNRYDESPYAGLVINHWQDKGKLRMNFVDMDALSIVEHLEEGIRIQEEPFGDPSILSHFQIMKAVNEKGLKVILGGQGSDEIFYGYDNMFQALTGGLLRRGRFHVFSKLVTQLHLSKLDVLRIAFGVMAPGLYRHSRRRSRRARRHFIQADILKEVTETKIHLARPDDFYDTWLESIRGVHLPHLVHYDDRNGMAVGIEGRMPFLDHRIVEFLASIKPEFFAWHGIRKYLLKEACTQYLPPEIKKRQDKIGFFAPIHEMIRRDIEFLLDEFQSMVFPLHIVDEKILLADLNSYRKGEIDVVKARRIWRVLSLCMWMRLYSVSFKA